VKKFIVSFEEPCWLQLSLYIGTPVKAVNIIYSL